MTLKNMVKKKKNTASSSLLGKGVSVIHIHFKSTLFKHHIVT